MPEAQPRATAAARRDGTALCSAPVRDPHPAFAG